MDNLTFSERLEVLNLANRIVGPPSINRTLSNHQDIVVETYKKLLPLFEVRAAKDEIKDWKD